MSNCALGLSCVGVDTAEEQRQLVEVRVRQAVPLRECTLSQASSIW
jgi:hypothetical protein